MPHIAIVGMACRYAGAASPAELWDNALAGRRAFRRIPPERLDLADYYGEDDPDRIPLTHAAVIDGYEFDRVAFGVSGPTYRSTDLTHWLALDMAARALADAGLLHGGQADPDTADRTAVYVGNTLTGEFTRAHVLRTRWPFVRRITARLLAERGIDDPGLLEELGRRFRDTFPVPDSDTLAGSLSNTIAGRICSHFGFGGGGYTVDGACAASLLAVINGCEELAAGRADIVVAGGVDLSIDPFEMVGFARTGALAREQMRVFDRRSQGFWPGEGCGMLVLTRLDDALARGLRPYAVLRGWGISSDGSAGITRPDTAGQRRALDRAYRRAGFGADTVAYFEAHGTGTAVGDRTELAALTQTLGAPGSPRAAIGSVKALIGHTKAAAGAAGLIKAAMAVHTQVLPPTVGCEDPHELLTGPQAVLRILREPEPWPADRPLRASVSAMGFGGINTHVTLEGVSAHRRRGLDPRTARLGATPQDRELFLFDGASPEELRENLRRTAEQAALLSQAQMADLAARLAHGRGAGRHRAAVVAATPEELVAALDTAAEAVGSGRRLLGPRVFTAPPRPDGALPVIGLLCSGQAARAGRGGGALARRFPEVAELYDRCTPPEGDPADTAVAQPRITTATVASLIALDTLGIRPALAVGHSLGELAALHWAGAVDRDDLLRLAGERGAAMAALPGEHGAMASVAAPAAEVEARLPEGTVVACVNGPNATVVSGRTPAVDQVVRDLGAVRLPVSHAFHSPLVAPAAASFRRVLDGVPLGAPRRRVLSTVTGAPLDPGTDLRAHLTRQITAPVRFTDAVAAAGPVDCWIEAGPGHILTGLVADLGQTAFAVDAGSASLSGLLRAAAAAWALGQDVRPEALFEGRLLRPLPADHRPVFLANPCESAPRDTAPAPAPRPAPASRPPTPQAADRPADPADPGDDPVEVVRRVVAERVELPLGAVTADSRLAADLHLNSITVAQLVAESARRLGVPVPPHVTEYAGASVAEIAEALGNAADGAGADEQEDTVAGVEPWVRVFTVEDAQRPLPAPRGTGTVRGRPRVVAAPGDRLAAELAEADLGEDTLVLCPPPDREPADATGLFAAAAEAVRRARRLVVVQVADGGPYSSGAAFARSVHLETGLPTAVVTVCRDDSRAAAQVTREVHALTDYSECRYHPDGSRTVPVLRPRPLGDQRPEEPPFSAEDVLLVSGGGKGIGLECARELALRTGVRLALLGRSDPDTDPELAAGLRRLTEDGVVFGYERADVCDAAAVREAVARLGTALGPVTAVLHAAGVNTPTPLDRLDRAELDRTVATKIAGARNLLAAVDHDRLRCFVAFGSLIARTGLPGEAHYALANEWLGALTEHLRRDLPHCRCLAVDWSVWAGGGMGERLGVLDALVRRGIDPIPLDTGVDLFHRLLAAPDLSGGVVVTGRYGDAPTLRGEPVDLPMLRYLERPRRLVPGVEFVADVQVSSLTDRYLDHHALEGQRLLPAVLGLEAMAQAAAVLAGTTEPPVFTDVSFAAPVVVPRDEEVTLRVAALLRPDGTVRTVLRSSTTRFAVDHFTASCAAKNGASAERAVPPEPVAEEPVPLRPDEELYGSLLFQDGPLRRVRAYRALSGYGCVAELAGDGSCHWFAPHLPPTLLLGDPGRRDAAIHALQACLPGTRLLPVGVERITVFGTAPADAVLHAREREASDQEHVFDFDVVDSSGTLLERWEGLRLRVMGAGPERIAPALLAPHLQRRVRDWCDVGDLRMTVEIGGTRVQRRARGVRRLLGPDVVVRGRGDGRPEVSTGALVSVTHSGDLTMVATAPGPVGVDLVRRDADGVDSVPWDDLLGADGTALAEVLAEAAPGEDPQTARARVWAAREALRKCTGSPAGPLVLRRREGRWTVLASGAVTVITHADSESVAAVAAEGRLRDA